MIPTNVTWQGDGQNAVWLIPFPYSRPEDVCVSIQDETGLEKRLRAGIDYTLQGQNVICIVPKGRKINIWLDGNLDAAVTANAQKATAGPVFEMTVQNEEPGVVAIAELENIKAEVERLLAEAGTKAADILSSAEVSSQSLSETRAADIEDILNRTAKYCETLREQCRREAVMAVKIGRQLSLYRDQPGISAVDSWENLPRLSKGLFVIVPGITHSPTPFMGIWPAKCINDMNFDGVFFIGPPYTEEVTLPPADTVPPSEWPFATGSGSDWVPCPHTHIDKCQCNGGDK